MVRIICWIATVLSFFICHSRRPREQECDIARHRRSTTSETRFTLEEIFPDSQMFPDSSVLESSDKLAFILKGYSDS